MATQSNLIKTVLIGSVLLLANVACIAKSITLDQQRSLFRDAESALKQKNSEQFRTILGQLEEYPLYPFLLYKSLLGRTNQLTDIKHFLETYPETPYANALRNNQLKLLASRSKWHRFLDLYEPTDNAKIQCLYYWGLKQTGQHEKALDGAKTMWLVGHSQPSECDNLFDLLKNQNKLSESLIWERFGLALSSGHPSFARYLKKLLPKKESNKADFWLKVYQSPQSGLLQWQSWPGNSPFYSEIFAQGLHRLMRKNLGLAIKIWDEGHQHFNLTPQKTASLKRELALRMVKKRHPGALDAIFTLTPEQDNEESRAWRIRAALVSHNWKRVDAALDRLTEQEQSTPRWQYWKARTLDELGQQQESVQLYKEIALERDFYGFLAADRIKLDYRLNNQPIDVPTQTTEQLAQTWPFRAMKEFLAVEHTLDARRLWWFTSQRLDQSNLLAAASLAGLWGWNDVAIITAAKAKHWDDMELRFPLAYKEQVLKHAADAELNPSLVYGVIRRESAFRADVSSRVGARGLMQIMPRTGRMLARRLKERWRSASQLYQPDTNLRYGTTYLKQLSDRYNNNLAMVAAAYNAGPHRVERWRPETQAIPADIWVESIPFNETRDYVKAVLAYMSIYDYRLGGSGLRINHVISDIPPTHPDTKLISMAKKTGV
ncbi:MAG: transglycosylase SLT domain-containing protein [Gammaproteobacteria bacterium]|nr:transglycosylase SLT domain-containing protein [Gammaproteobacteria bacterium]